MQPWSVRTEPPLPRPHGVSGQAAVELCREWMVYLGAANTIVATGPAKGFCDLYSDRHLAWVRDQRENLDVEPVNRAANTAASDGRQAIIFVPGGVRPVAQDLADALGVALLWYDAQDGALDGGNLLGRDICSKGLSPS